MIRRLVEGFNVLDAAAHEHFIETLQREENCSELEEVAFLAGFPDPAHVADPWRKW